MSPPQLAAVQALPKVCSPSSDHGVDCLRLAVDCCVCMAATQELWEALVPCLPPLLLCGGHHRASEPAVDAALDLAALLWRHVDDVPPLLAAVVEVGGSG